MRATERYMTAVGAALCLSSLIAWTTLPMVPPIACVENGTQNGQLRCMGDCNSQPHQNCRGMEVAGSDPVYWVCTCDGTEPLCCHVRFYPDGGSGDPMVGHGGNCIQCGLSGFCVDNNNVTDPQVACNPNP